MRKERSDMALRARLPLLGGITVNPEGALGRRLLMRHEELSYQAFLQRRRVRLEWASYK